MVDYTAYEDEDEDVAAKKLPSQPFSTESVQFKGEKIAYMVTNYTFVPELWC